MPDPTPQPAKPEFRRCRSLTVLGRPCNQRAQRGRDLCIAHAGNRFPVYPQGDKIAIPLLEDLPTVRVVATQVAHGLFTQVLDPWRAGKILYALQVAAMTLPRPAPAAATSAQLVLDQPVTETFPGPDGHPIGPVANWQGYGGRYEPAWRHDKYLYEQECKRLGKPLPETPPTCLPAAGSPSRRSTTRKWATTPSAKLFSRMPSSTSASRPTARANSLRWPSANAAMTRKAAAPAPAS